MLIITYKETGIKEELPMVAWHDILRIVYVRDKRLFEILKDKTEILQRKEFDMNIVTYRLKKYKK